VVTQLHSNLIAPHFTCPGGTESKKAFYSVKRFYRIKTLLLGKKYLPGKIIFPGKRVLPGKTYYTVTTFDLFTFPCVK